MHAVGCATRGAAAYLDLARALAAHGCALLDAGHLAKARDQLRRAHKLAEWCGATTLAGNTQDELARATAYPPPGAELPGRLTRSEWSVAELAADGLTNRAIAAELGVVRRTVEIHLTSAYRKLGVSGRSQLVRALHESRTG